MYVSHSCPCFPNISDFLSSHSLQVLADLPTSSQPPTPYERKPSLAVVSGYATGQNHPPLDLSDLDPTLFGLLPHANNTWLGDTQADMSVFDMEGDVNKWLEASSSIPNWVQDPRQVFCLLHLRSRYLFLLIVVDYSTIPSCMPQDIPWGPTSAKGFQMALFVWIVVQQ